MGSCQGRPVADVHLDPLTAPHVTYNRAGNEAQRSSVGLHFLADSVFSSYWHAFRHASELSASVIPVRSQNDVDRRFLPLRFSRSCLRPPLLPGFYPHSQGATWARCTLGFDLKPGPITSVTGPGWLGAAICLAISRDLAITRSHPNKASGCRCRKPFR